MTLASVALVGVTFGPPKWCASWYTFPAGPVMLLVMTVEHAR